MEGVNRRRRKLTGSQRVLPDSDGRLKVARISLILLLFWPVFVCVIVYSRSPVSARERHYLTAKNELSKLRGKTKEKLAHLKGNIKSFLTHEIVGYGPSRPRVAVVVVGDDPIGLVRSVESAFRFTDRNRILTVVVVCSLDDETERSRIENELKSIDNGDTHHWHGLDLHKSHLGVESSHDHSKKIHIIHTSSETSIVSSRQKGATFAKNLADKHEEAGLKDPEEDIILVLLRQDSALISTSWIDAVGSSLILPQNNNNKNKVKLANAVSFAVDYGDLQSADGTTASFDMSLNPHWVKAADNNNQKTFPTAALSGACTAMRLETYLNLPAQDINLDTNLSADLELAFNLWLCGDGVDIIPQARVTVDKDIVKNIGESPTLTDQIVARLVATWIDKDEKFTARVFQARNKFNHIKKSKFDKLIKQAKKDDTLPNNMQTKCRPFKWFANVNPELIKADVIKTVEHHFMKQEGNVVKLVSRREGQDQILPDKIYHAKIPEPKLIPPRHRVITTENLEILSHAKSVNLEYINVNDNQYPHMGAMDQNNQPHFIHHEQDLFQDPPQLNMHDKEKLCAKSDGNYKMLTQKVSVDMKNHDEANRNKLTNPRVKLFCVVYTQEKSHDRIPAIRETWGQKCDGFMVASTKTDTSINAVNILHEGEEAYQNIWQKVRSIWAYIYDNYYQDYDFFHIGGDDLYVLVENMRLYLESEEIKMAAMGGQKGTDKENHQKPLFLGRRFAEQGNTQRIFNSGGAGYTINKAALKALVVDGFPTCFPHLVTFAEDVMVASCFRKMGILPLDTRDGKGGERYMPFAPAHHLTYKVPADPASDWYAKYMAFGMKTGLDHCAAHSVAFHYIKPDLMRRMHAILYGHCD